MSKFDSGSPKKQLFLDVGNSSVKGAYKEGAGWKAVKSDAITNARQLNQWIQNHPNDFSEIIVAGVRTDVQEAFVLDLSSKGVKVREVTSGDIPPDLLDYETPETLGVDRFLACYGATFLTQKAVVVIDAGTATTIDYMGHDKIYRGGVIAPGLEGFTRILPQLAPALPNVDIVLPENWPGKSTKDSLRWGQAGFYAFALKAMLQRYQEEFSSYELFITGGNGKIIQQLLPGESKLRPYLIFEGLDKLISAKQ